MQPTRLGRTLMGRTLIVCCAAMFAAICQPAVAGTLCVNPAGSHNCFSSIQTAVNHASANDLIQVEAGTYKEEVALAFHSPSSVRVPTPRLLMPPVSRTASSWMVSTTPAWSR